MKFKFYCFFIIISLVNYSCNNDSDQNLSENVLSKNKYGGSKEEEFNSTVLTSDGGQIISARTSSIDGDVFGNISYTNPSDASTNYNNWIFKLDKKGKIEWQKTYGGSKQEYESKIIQTTDGGYIFCSSTNSNDGDIKGLNPNLNSCSWIVKINSAGVIQWQKVGDNDGAAIDIVQTADGGYIYCNYKSLVKLNTKGDVLWSSQIDLIVKNMTQLTNGDLVMSGYKSISQTNDIGRIVKFSSAGALLWQNDYQSLPNKVIEENDGGFFLVGSTNDKSMPNYHSGFNNGNSDVWVAKLNSLGIIEWQKAFGGTLGEYGKDVIKSGDNYIIGADAGSGNEDLTANHGYLDYWIFKINKIGTLIWQKEFGGLNYDYLGSILKSPNGNLVLTGMSSSFNQNLDSDIWILNVKE